MFFMFVLLKMQARFLQHSFGTMAQDLFLDPPIELPDFAQPKQEVPVVAKVDWHWSLYDLLDSDANEDIGRVVMEARFRFFGRFLFC